MDIEVFVNHHNQKAMKDTEWDEVRSYARSRKREAVRSWGLAKFHLAAAKGAHALRPTAQTRSNLVRTMANMELATAAWYVWEVPRKQRARLSHRVPIHQC